MEQHKTIGIAFGIEPSDFYAVPDPDSDTDSDSPIKIRIAGNMLFGCIAREVWGRIGA